LTPCVPDGVEGVLAYGSGQTTEGANGAPYVTVPPRTGGVKDNGLDKPTHFFPGILVQMPFAALPRPTETLWRMGRERPRAARLLSGELNAIKRAARAAHGLDPEPGDRYVSGMNSWRGCLVALSDAYYQRRKVRFAVIVTAHRYSAVEHYQVIIPVVSAGADESSDEAVRVEDAPWLGCLGPHVRAALIAVPLIESVWHEDYVIEGPLAVLDSAVMAEVEDRIATYLGL
jgi:hypothetical protein